MFCSLFITSSYLFSQTTNKNIIVILVDDLGFADPGFMGGFLETPNIDSLATEGTVYHSFYNFTKCTPSRASLMSGRYPINSGFGESAIKSNGSPMPGIEQGYFINGMEILPQYLRRNGYNVLMSGKWHLGSHPSVYPSSYGFNDYVSLINGASIYFNRLEDADNRVRTLRLIKNDQVIHSFGDDFYITDYFTSKALDQLNEHNRDYPFFLYLAYTAPHWPLQAPDSLIEKFKNRFDEGWDLISRRAHENLINLGLFPENTIKYRDLEVKRWETIEFPKFWSEKMEVYAAQVYSLDIQIGRLITYLKEQNLYDETMIFFLSDNGAASQDVNDINAKINARVGSKDSYTAYLKPWAMLSNTPFRDYKGSLYEGGIRNNLIVKWPKSLEDTPDAHIVGSIQDIFPTIVDYIDQGESSMLDGVSLFNNEIDQRTLFWRFRNEVAVRRGKFKLVYNPLNGWQLFDLKDDPTETLNIITLYPEEVVELSSLIEDWITETNTPIEYVAPEYHIQIYPNPSSDFISIQTIPSNNIIKVKLFGSNGTLMIKEDNIGGIVHNLNISNLIAGTYLLHVYMEEGPVFVEKVLKN